MPNQPLPPMTRIDVIKGLSGQIRDICVQFVILPDPMAWSRIAELQGEIEHQIHLNNQEEETAFEAAWAEPKNLGFQVLRSEAELHAALLAAVRPVAS